MSLVKTHFSIRDLENLSGIKAHTIRIWEKRYKLLTPERTKTNIRTYSIESLQKLLNVTMLYKNGYKISKIGLLSENEIPKAVNKIVDKNCVKNHSINTLKLAMINFDPALFLTTYDKLLKELSFRDICKNVFFPLLNELGFLWQTKTIWPAHQHFISGLILQKIHANTEKIQHRKPTKTDKVFVLYLPEKEIHEIGLLYMNYEIIAHGYKTIYLGQTTPMQNLATLMQSYKNSYFISYFTIAPYSNYVVNYAEDFREMALAHDDTSKLWILGWPNKPANAIKLPPNVRDFDSIQEVIAEL